MDQAKKQFWYNGFAGIIACAALVACGKQEEVNVPPAPVEQPASMSENPEAFAKDEGISDTAAYVSSDSSPGLGVYLADSVSGGAIVTEIVSDSLASKLDLAVGDVIVGAGESSITNAQDFNRLFGSTDSGITIVVVLNRGGVEKHVEIRKL